MCIPHFFFFIFNTFFSVSVNFLFGFLLLRVSTSVMSVCEEHRHHHIYTIITAMYYCFSLDDDMTTTMKLTAFIFVAARKIFMEEFLFTPSTVDWNKMFMKKKALIIERVYMAVVWVICKYFIWWKYKLFFLGCDNENTDTDVHFFFQTFFFSLDIKWFY